MNTTELSIGNIEIKTQLRLLRSANVSALLITRKFVNKKNEAAQKISKNIVPLVASISVTTERTIERNILKGEKGGILKGNIISLNKKSTSCLNGKEKPAQYVEVRQLQNGMLITATIRDLLGVSCANTAT